MIFQNLKKLSFGLATLLFLALSFTACTNEEDNQLSPAAAEFSLEKGLALPTVVFNQGTEAISAHLTNANDATLVTYQNNYILSQYLVEFGKMTEVTANLNDEANIADINLADYLEAGQIDQIQAHLTTSISSSIERGCVPTYHWNQWCQCWAPGPPFCW